ncbi:hypothetical protein MPC4_80138 [Methylocella tundrae]|uniref:Uncharacterized protein n=1 Tax=Methylocella tundrae TaxID=227605 RepID=A0A8B6MBQ8_METTU|nr:hypothetical protein [Methylocella tundrae]VTZ24362.1 hypothetical protein MPC1_170013 [Methylocella tundrae]VTZ52467.1 hypothetical protein MPC4_80138 [Methylocella tundrae]
MLIDFSTDILDLSGEPILDAAEKTLKLGALSVNAIMTPKSALSGEENVKRLGLALRINAGGEIEVTPEEAALIKKCAAEAFLSPLIVGRMFEALNG